MTSRAKRGADASTSEPRRTGRPKGAAQAVGAEELVRQCRLLLRRIPPAELTFANLARHAGVTPTLVKYYFKDRSELLVAVVALLVTEEHGRLDKAGAAGLGPVELLRLFIADLLALHRSDPHFSALMLEKVIHSDSETGRRLFEETTHRVAALLGGIVSDGVEQGQMRPIDIPDLQVSIIAMCQFYGTAQPIMKLLGRSGRPGEWKAYADFIFETVMSGIGTKKYREKTVL